MSELTETDATDYSTLAVLDRVVIDSRQAIAKATVEGNEIAIAFTQATAISQLKSAMTDDFMRVVMPLQGSALGFLTDRDTAGGYSMEVVRESMIVALMSGVGLTGNQWNIIAGKCYITLAGVERIVYGWPGIEFSEDPPGVPRVEEAGAGALCEMSARWKLNGKEDSISCVRGGPDDIDTRIPVRVNKGMGADAILGKARRKFLFRVWKRLLGSGVPGAPVAEVEDITCQPDPEFDAFLSGGD